MCGARQGRHGHKEVLQMNVDRALQGLLPEVGQLPVTAFGSRVYGAAGPMSDYDFYLELPKRYAAQAKVLRACIRQHLIDAGVTSWPKSHDEPENYTLKWATLQEDENVSINIAEEGSVRHAVLATQFLEQIFRPRKTPPELCDEGC